jgi:toxin ParE1/3/4
MRLRWTTPALRDLEAIGELTARDNPAGAAKTIAAILDQGQALTRHPEIGRPGRIADTRELIVARTPFVVPYRARGDDVEILAVFHGARQWPEKLG